MSRLKNCSIPAQLDLLRSFSQANDYEIFKEYVDKGESETISERPELQELLIDARRGMFKGVLVYRIDRFFRNTRKLLNTVDELTKVGVSFRSVTEPFDTSNPIGNFMVSFVRLSWKMVLPHEVASGASPSECSFFLP